MELTAKQLKEYLDKVPDDSIIRFQHIDDKYINGMYQISSWENKEEIYRIKGWTTYDMPCDTANEDCGGKNKNKQLWKCPVCELRNRYINATRCFIKDNQLFIDGHY